jgi:O-antigen/teichoic acid export membrane protein
MWNHDPADPRSKRRRLVVLAAAYGAIARVVSICANLAQVPIALHYLKSEAFGLWMTLVGAVQLMSFADLGIGLGLQNKISEAYGRDDLQGVRNLYKTGWLTLAFVGMGIALVGLPVCWLVPWGQVFKISDPQLKRAVPGALAVIVAFFSLGLPLNAGLRLAVGLQLGWVTAVWSAASSVVCLGLIVLGRHWGVGFVVFVGMAMAAPVIGNIGVIGHTFYILGKRFSILTGYYERGVPRALLRQGLLFLVPQAGAVVMNSAPNVMIASILGTTAVTPFSICQRLTNTLLQLQQLPLAALWPAFAEAKSRGDSEWIWTTFVKSCYYAAITAAAFSVGVILLGGKVIKLWTNGSVILEYNTLISFGALMMIVGSIGAIPYFLNGCGELHGQAIAGLSSAGLLLLITPLALKIFGLNGAVYAILFSWTFGMLFVLPSIAKVYKILKNTMGTST